jgi:hypothetical protein
MAKKTETKPTKQTGRPPKFKPEIERLYKKIKGTLKSNRTVNALANDILDNWDLDGEPPTGDYVRQVVRSLGGVK